MKFDSNLAWRQASAAVGANRDVVFPLAGVFFMLPTLGLALFVPPPDPMTAAGTRAVVETLNSYYASILPFVVPMALFQAVGTLALLTLLTDRRRPTVGEAIRLGLQGIVTYLVAQVLIAVSLGVSGGLVIAIAMASGAAALTAVGVAGVLAAAVYVAIRTSLTAPVVVVEGVRNPLAAIQQSWRLTRGNAARIGLFYLLAGIAFLFVIMAISLIAGILFRLVGSAEFARIAEAVISSGLNAVMALYFVAIFAAVHGQLSTFASGRGSDLSG